MAQLQVTSVAFSADGQRLAFNTGETLQSVTVLHVPSGKQRLSLGSPGTNWSRVVAFSPDGLRLASVGDFLRDGQGLGEMDLALWDGACGLDTRVLGKHTLPITDVAFSADGRRIAAVSAMPIRNGILNDKPQAPGETTVWDINTGREMLSLGEPNDMVLAVAVSQDGKRISNT